MINKIKETIKKFISRIQVQVFVVTFLVMLIPVAVFAMAIVGNAKEKYLSQKIEKLQHQNTMLKNCIVSESYMDTLDSALVKAEINRLSNGYDGRIQIINSHFEIVSDSFSSDEGKTCISPMILKAIKGENVSFYDEKKAYLEFATPIVITTEGDGKDKQSDNKVIGALYFRYSTSDIDDFLSEMTGSLNAFALIVFFMAIAVAYAFAKYISSPFKKAEQSLVQITNGDTVTEIEIDGYTEMIQMVDAINHLLDKLSVQEQSRQEFVSNVSHELKTPITSMKVLADSLIGQENVPEELYQEFLTDIGKEIDRENDIITDLLSLVRMDNGRTDVNIGQYNVNEIVEQTLKRLRPIAAAKNIEVVFESFRPVVADIDDVKMTIVISNLVENAIKYNVNDGWVRVSLNADHQYFYIKVADSGIGIDEEDQDKIYDRFFRVDKARSRQTGGTGLGLAITRKIILLHKGTVKVHSKRDEGTTFTVRIPLKYIK